MESVRAIDRDACVGGGRDASRKMRDAGGGSGAYTKGGTPKPYIERAGRHMSVGRQGESAASSYLEIAGYEILRRNFTCRLGEIDIIARPRGENTLCFIEVKCRRSGNMGRPGESVGIRKQRHYRQVATIFLMREWDGLRVDASTEYRFDVVEVVLNAGKPRINHIKGAFM